MEISDYKYNLMVSVNAIKGLQNVIGILQLAKETKEGPTKNNPDYNKNVAWEIEQKAELEYENSINKLKCCEIIPLNWVPSFNELKKMVNK